MSNGLELYSIRELVAELAKRTTFYGVIAYMPTDLKQAPRDGADMALRLSAAITDHHAVALLRSALEAVEAEAAEFPPAEGEA